MTMTVSTRIKGRSAALAAGQRRHDLRLGRIPKYVAIGKIKDNSIILKTPLESRIRRECEELRELNPHERNMKADAAIVTVGIITFGKLAQPIIRALPKEEQDAIYKDIAERIAKKGDTKLLGLVVHRDESAPHAHYTLRGVNNFGFPMSEVFKSKQTKELQDLAGQVLADHGHGEIKRGKPKKDRIRDHEPTSKWVNRSVKQLHEDIPVELDAAQERLETIFDDQDAAEERLKKINEEIETKQAEKNVLDKEIQGKRAERNTLDEEIKEKNEELNGMVSKVKYYNNLIEKAKDQLKNEENFTEKEKQKRIKRISVYDNRINNLVKDVATLESLSIKDIRESLEKTGHLSPALVMPYDEDDHAEYEDNQGRDSDRLCRDALRSNAITDEP